MKLNVIVFSIVPMFLISCGTETDYTSLENKKTNIKNAIYELREESKINENIIWNKHEFQDNHTLEITDNFFEVCYPHSVMYSMHGRKDEDLYDPNEISCDRRIIEEKSGNRFLLKKVLEEEKKNFLSSDIIKSLEAVFENYRDVCELENRTIKCIQIKVGGLQNYEVLSKPELYPNLHEYKKTYIF